jgi:hypothetical protein
MKNTIITLYRPVGQTELELIEKSEWTAFPPRLPSQPFFYPVVHESYAVQIARDWNAKDSGAGFVTRFQMAGSVLSVYVDHRVGSSQHLEYWIPARDLPAFNAGILGKIEVIASFHGVNREGEIYEAD